MKIQSYLRKKAKNMGSQFAPVSKNSCLVGPKIGTGALRPAVMIRKINKKVQILF